MKKIIFLLFFTFLFANNDNIIKCGVLKNLAPFSIKKDKSIEGISIDYWKLIEKNLHIKTRCEVYNSWQQLLTAFTQNKIDLVLLSNTNLNIKNGIFSKGYDKYPIAIATKDNIAFVPDIRVLKHKPIGIIKDSIASYFIKKRYPNIKFRVFNNIEEALNSVEEGDTEAIIDLLPVLIYGIHENNFLSIRISGKIPIYVNLEIMLNNKYKYLVPKINKEIDNISIDERLTIYNKWLKLENFWTWEKIEFMLGIGGFILALLFVSVFILVRDIKRRKKLEIELIASKEKAEIATRAKSEFLANMSHEIRTPLNAIFGFITILKDNETNKEKQKYLTIIEKSGETLKNIINDILDFSKIEAGKFEIEKREVNIKKDIEILVSLFKSKANEKNLNLELEIENLDYMIFTDSIRFKQIISNLLSNAIKFTNKNKNIKLTVKYDDKKEMLYVEVQDEGIGIEKEKLEHIFEAFSQADTSTTRKYGGTGLGLTISYRLVEMLGGKLKVQSEVGKGSKFYFTIPAKKGKLIEKEEKKEDKILDNTYNLHVLLVEDNKANQMFMKVIFKKMGLTFDIANNGIEAIEKFKNNRYDLILMDENMPEMNGMEATKKIREYEEKHNLKRTFISALTANALHGDKEKFIESGMDFYLSKPLDIEKLKNILNKINKSNLI